MPVVGFQDYWRAGSRFHFIEDPISTSPLLDLGTIETANPTITATEVELQDGDGGVLRTVAKEITEFKEAYELAIKNFSPANLRFLMYGSNVQSWSQAATIRQIGHMANLGSLLKLRSSYVAPYEFIYNLQEMMALGIAPNYPITAVSSTVFTITLPGTAATSTRLSAGDRILVYGNATSAANVEYTVVSVASTGATATVTVADTKGATISGRVGIISATPSNVMSQPITGGSSTTITIAGDWTEQYPAASRLHYWGGTTTSVGNNSAPASADPASTNTGLNTYLVASVAFATGTTTITIDATTPLPATPTASGTISRAARLGYDWELGDLNRGYLRIRSDATLIAAGQPVTPIFLPRAISASDRLLYPQARSGPFSGTAILEWGRGGGAARSVREFSCILTPVSSGISITEFSSFNLKAEVIADVTNTTSPAGRLLQYKGDLPSKS